MRPLRLFLTPSTANYNALQIRVLPACLPNHLRLSVYMCTICRWAGLNAAGFWCQSCRPCGLCRHCTMRLSVSLVVSRTALGVSDWPCGVRVSHKKVQMSPLNAAPNSNDNSMLMTLTLCQSSSQSNSVTAHCHTTPPLPTADGDGIVYLGCSVGRSLVLSFGSIGSSVCCLSNWRTNLRNQRPKLILCSGSILTRMKGYS